MEVLYSDREIAVVIKPCGVLSQEGEGSVHELLASELGKLYTVHRLDRAVGGVMVYARTPAAAAALTRAMGEGALQKEYTAIVAGAPPAEGAWEDMLYHDARQNKTFVVERARKGAKKALLSYSLVDTREVQGQTLSRVKICLYTGRTHQIRVQFASRGYPLVGDGKYGSRVKAPFVALAATGLAFPHPQSGKTMHFAAPVPEGFPWQEFGESHFEIERKFLIAYPDERALAAMERCRVKHLAQTYLKAPAGVTDRVREVREGECVRYIRTTKRRVSMLRALEEECEVSRDEYERLLESADLALRTIRKTRYAIPFAGHVVEVDVFDFWQDRALAEVELADEGEAFTLPDAIKVLREVTDDVRYKNVNLARNLPTEN